MKRYLCFMYVIFIGILLLPSVVYAKNADISIKSIEVVDNSEHASEITPAEISNGTLKLDLIFWNVDDYIKYKITIDNKDSESYYLNLQSNDSILSYTLSDHKINKNGTTTLDFIVKYNKEVSEEQLDKKIDKIVSFVVSNEKGDLVNPKTGHNYLLIIAVLIISSLVLYKKNKTQKNTNIVHIIFDGNSYHCFRKRYSFRNRCRLHN